ncbi:MAG TPA: TRAP transporter large permease subunit [Treponemataceae bacterium]|nr:TRAP transporter large permease subunit [Treponemataceae bacterium]HQL03598.1 TRAP transporter large permease subunit [Treponemataceae bacterium]
MKIPGVSVTKIENFFSTAFILLLAILPLILKIISQGLKLPIVNADNAQVNIVFIFACISGMITWREDKHISLASLTDKIPGVLKKAVLIIRSASVTAILTALFFSSFSEFFVAFMPSQKIWGIPLQVVFAVMPFSFLVMIIRSLYKKEQKISSFAGLLIGLYISLGPISGILYYMFGLDNLNLMYSLTNSWLSFSVMAFLPLVLLLVFLALLGVPLFIVISGIAYVAFSQGGGYVEVISLESYTILTDKSIAAIPLFTIAGYILSKGSAGYRLVSVFKTMFGWFKGGIVIAAVLVTTFFTIFTGASGVTILALGSLLTIALGGAGYSKDDSQSLITASGALGLLFPPSVAIIMYGSVNYFSVDVYDIFKGALIPGMMLAASMILLGLFRDKQEHRPSFSLKEILLALKDGIFEILLPFFVIIGFFSGFFSLMEAAAFTLIYALVLETFIRKDFDVKKALTTIAEGIPITGGVLLILASARGLSYFMVDANVPAMLTDFITNFVHSKYLFLLLMNIFLIFAGCLMDIYSAILIISPLLIPIAESFGISPVHTAVIFLVNMQLGFLTPPVGMDLFVATYAFETPLMKIVKGILPFLLVQAVVLLLITYIPWFTTVLL